MTSIRVCVTGATGYIATHVVDQLLASKSNYLINATVRNVKTPAKYAHLTQLVTNHNRDTNALQMFEANLTDKGSFDSAIEGCEYVIHTASPYIIDVADPQKDLVDPAVNGTLNVLETCLKHKVKRVVLTSSVAAITDAAEEQKEYTENDWNSTSALTRNPYYYSKLMAEKAAWDFVKRNPGCFELVTINPSAVIGPEFQKESVNQSVKIFVLLTQGMMPMIINLNWAFVDVRDVAKAHVLAMESDRSFDNTKPNEGRYIVAADSKNMEEVCALLREMKDVDTSKLPSTRMTNSFGNLLVKGMSFFQPKQTGQYLRTNIGKPLYFSNRKIREELGMTFMDTNQSIRDTIEDLMERGHIVKSTK